MAPKQLTSPCQEQADSCSSDLHSDLNNLYTERMRNKQKHINVTVANQFTVQETSYKKFFFNEIEGENIEHQTVFSQHFTVIKKFGALLFDEERPIFEEQLWQ